EVPGVRVLEREPTLGELGGEIQECEDGGLEHRRTPLVRIRDERNGGVAEHERVAVELDVRTFGLDQQALSGQLAQDAFVEQPRQEALALGRNRTVQPAAPPQEPARAVDEGMRVVLDLAGRDPHRHASSTFSTVRSNVAPSQSTTATRGISNGARSGWTSCPAVVHPTS